MTQILVFGDSITYGAWDIKGGWAGRLKSLVTKKTIATNQKFYCTVHNLGISGNTTTDLLERAEFETEQRLKEPNETIFIFNIGVNDAIHDRRDIAWTEPEKFRENLEKLIGIARKYSSKIVFIGIMPVNEAKASPVFWDAEVFYSNARLEKYNGIIKTVCAKNNAHFIDIFRKLIKSDYKNLLEDGVHPNSKGHKMIFDEVKKLLIMKNIIAFS